MLYYICFKFKQTTDTPQIFLQCFTCTNSIRPYVQVNRFFDEKNDEHQQKEELMFHV